MNQSTLANQRTLFFCSRMAPFGERFLRQQFSKTFGANTDNNNKPFRLLVEDLILEPDDDARPPCARDIQSCDGVVLLLDGVASLPRSALDAAVLELEVMIAAVCAKPVLVIDASDGADPLFTLLGSEFFHRGSGGGISVISINGGERDVVAQVSQILDEACSGGFEDCVAFDQGVGWEKLFLARPDRMQIVSDDGGNFPFSQSGLNGFLSESNNMMSSDIRKKLDIADYYYQLNIMTAIVYAWDAIRALSTAPWGNVHNDKPIALLWLRALKIWGGGMSWLGVFGHSTGAAVMATLAGAHISFRLDIPKAGDTFAKHSYLGALASTYFSLSKLAVTPSNRKQMRSIGIKYANEALQYANNPRVKAGILAVRGPLLLSSGIWGVRGGLRDLSESVRLHYRASNGVARDHGLACAQLQLGAAYKELAKWTLHNPIALWYAYRNLQQAHETLEEHPAEIGQLLMCKKHLVDTLLLQGQEDKAYALWRESEKLAFTAGVVDQRRQLLEFAKGRNWDDGSRHN